MGNSQFDLDLDSVNLFYTSWLLVVNRLALEVWYLPWWASCFWWGVWASQILEWSCRKYRIYLRLFVVRKLSQILYALLEGFTLGISSMRLLSWFGHLPFWIVDVLWSHPTSRAILAKCESFSLLILRCTFWHQRSTRLSSDSILLTWSLYSKRRANRDALPKMSGSIRVNDKLASWLGLFNVFKWFLKSRVSTTATSNGDRFTGCVGSSGWRFGLGSDFLLAVH